MSLTKNHVIFYSEQCKYSKELIELIHTTAFRNTFVKINVDYNRNLPKSIKTVPTIIVPTHKEPLSGNSAFMWVSTMSRTQGESGRQQQQQQQQGQGQSQGQQTNNGDDDISPFFASEMSSKFSDNFSFIENNNPLMHQFSFLDESMGNQGQGQGQGQESSGNARVDERISSMDTQYERLMQERNNDMAIGHVVERR